MRKLEDAGASIGHKVLELSFLREEKRKRETRMLGILQFISSTVWKMLFGSSADALERAVEQAPPPPLASLPSRARCPCPPPHLTPALLSQEDEFMIIEKSPMVNTYISSPPCNCAAFIAGIVRGVLEGAQFPARVTAHEHEDSRTIILVKFAPEVLEREKRAG